MKTNSLPEVAPSGSESGSDVVKCSGNFERAFGSNSGGCVRDCDCGRTNYDYYNTWDWDEGELEALIEKSKKEPSNYVGHDYSVSTISVDGREIVMGCPCNSARKYEDWILNHAEQIAEYLNLRADDLLKEAERTTVKGNKTRR